MLTEGVSIKIGNREFNLVLNTEAMAQLCEEFGDITGVTERINAASYAEKIRLIPRLIALLATQGEAINGNEEIVTPEFVTRNTLPKDLPEMTGYFLRAIEIGMNVKISTGNEDTDAVLAQILKNADSAAGT